MLAAVMITAASKAAITIVRLKGPRGFGSPRRAPALSTPGEAVADFSDPRFFSEFCLERATIFYPPPAYDPLCPDSDQTPQRSEMTRWAMKRLMHCNKFN